MINSIVNWLKAHHWIHSWGRWEKGSSHITETCFGKPVGQYDISIQIRECAVCGLEQTRDI